MRNFMQTQPTSSKPLIILIAGPYRSGTGDDPAKMSTNLRRLEDFALPIYKTGHIPMIGEWVALPILRSAGSKEVGDFVYEAFLYPVAARLLDRCDAVLRISGESKGADQDVRIARERGLPVFYAIDEIPVLNPTNHANDHGQPVPKPANLNSGS
jgi:hypothetical protein